LLSTHFFTASNIYEQYKVLTNDFVFFMNNTFINNYYFDFKVFVSLIISYDHLLTALLRHNNDSDTLLTENIKIHIKQLDNIFNSILDDIPGHTKQV